MSAQKIIRLSEIPDIPLPDDPATQNGHKPHTWQPANLLELAANPPAPPTIGGLLYPGKRTVLSGETESMKTWLALILCKAELDIDLTVGWVDLDAMGPGALLERLQLLGVPDEAIADRFLYYQPSEMLDPGKIANVADTVAIRGIRLFVIDAFNPILSLHGLEPNSVTDVETFWRTIADPIAQAGAAPVLLDHVVKNTENRGKYSTGSERKASGVDGCHIGFRLLEPLTKGGKGRTLLTVHKDRPGYLPRPTLGRLIIDATEQQISYQLEPDKSHDQGGGFRPTILMEKISRSLETQNEPVTQKWVKENIGGNNEAKTVALTTLVRDDYLAETRGARNALLYHSIRPYRESEDTPDDSPRPTSPDLAHDLTSKTTSPIAPYPTGARWSMDPGEQGEATSPNRIWEYDHPPPDLTLEPDQEEIE